MWTQGKLQVSKLTSPAIRMAHHASVLFGGLVADVHHDTSLDASLLETLVYHHTSHPIAA